MAKLGSTLKTLGTKAGKGVSRVKRKSAILGKKAIKGTRKSIYGGVAKGRNLLKGTGKKIGPIRPDLKEGGVRKINRLVETRVQNLVPKLSEKIEQKVDSFDPNKFLGKIFDGGLNSLNQFGSSLDGMKGSVQDTVGFLQKATNLASKFVNKLASAKGGGIGGLFKTIIKAIALGGVAAMATPLIANVALAGALHVGGKALWKKGTEFIGGLFRKKKKKKKEEQETKVKKEKSNLFESILGKFEKTLNFLNKGSKKKKIVGKPGGQEPPSEVESKTEPTGLKASAATIQEVAGGEMIIRTAPTSNWREGTVDDPGPRVSDDMQSLLNEKTKAMETLTDYTPDERGNKDPEYLKLHARVDELDQLIKAQEAREQGHVAGAEVKGAEVIPQKGQPEKGDQGVEGKKGGLGGFLQQSFNTVKNVAGSVINAHPAVMTGKMIGNALTGGAAKPKKVEAKEAEGKKGFWGTLGSVAEGVGRVAGLGPIIDVAKSLRSESADAISQPPKGGAPDSGVVPIKMPTGGGAAGTPPPNQPKSTNVTVEEEMKNRPPSLIAMDRRNLHTAYSKSTFNIVDAM